MSAKSARLTSVQQFRSCIWRTSYYVNCRRLLSS